MPAVFRAVRALCGIDEADYMVSTFPHYLVNGIASVADVFCSLAV